MIDRTINLNSHKVQSQIVSLLENIQFYSIPNAFCTEFKLGKVGATIDNLTNWQKQRLENIRNRAVELEELLIKTGVIL